MSIKQKGKTVEFGSVEGYDSQRKLLSGKSLKVRSCLRNCFFIKYLCQMDKNELLPLSFYQLHFHTQQQFRKSKSTHYYSSNLLEIENKYEVSIKIKYQ